MSITIVENAGDLKENERVSSTAVVVKYCDQCGVQIDGGFGDVCKDCYYSYEDGEIIEDSEDDEIEGDCLRCGCSSLNVYCESCYKKIYNIGPL